MSDHLHHHADIRNSYSLNDETIVKSGQPLEAIIEELDQFSKGKLHSESGRSFTIITDGQLHLRQVLHPEACTKGITLPSYFSSFYDLRKEFKKFYRNPSINSIQDMTNYLCMEPDASADSAIQKVQDMAKIIIRLINDGQSHALRAIIIHYAICFLHPLFWEPDLSVCLPFTSSLLLLLMREEGLHIMPPFRLLSTFMPTDSCSSSFSSLPMTCYAIPPLGLQDINSKSLKR